MNDPATAHDPAAEAAAAVSDFLSAGYAQLNR